MRTVVGPGHDHGEADNGGRGNTDHVEPCVTEEALCVQNSHLMAVAS